MKIKILAVLSAFALASAVHAQQAVVIHRPGILTDLTTAAGVIAAMPLALAEGIVTGTAEAAGSLLHGSTQVVVTPAPVVVQPQVVAPAPVVVQPQVVAPAPVVVQPQVVAPAPVVVQPQVVVPAPQIRPVTTVTTVHRDGTTVSVSRPASGYELGNTLLVPVDPGHRVGPSPYVNPYVFRHR